MREGEIIGGRYVLQEQVGRGAFGVVWRAEERVRGVVVGVVAVKEFSAEVDLREMAVLAGMSHPNILGYRTTLEDRGAVCLVTEYAEGGSARDLLRAHPGGVPQELVREILLGAARGLAHLHERGLVHRDVKPDNILLGEGRVLLGDVGTAKALEGSMGAHSGPGSVGYAAPEMFGDQVGPSSDVYGLGVTAYELLLGRLPFEGNLAAVMAGHMTREPEIPASMHPRWKALLAGCLAKDPRHRWALERLIRQLQGEEEIRSVVPPARPEPRRAPAASPAARAASNGPPLSAQQVQSALTGLKDRGALTERLFQSALGSGDLDTLRLLGAALLAVAAPDERLDEVRKRAGGALELGIPEQPWPLIPAGKFRMGCPETEKEGYSAERPQHTVRIAAPFHLLATPVTQALHLVVTGKNPSQFTGDLRRPVELVSYTDAVQFCEALSRLLGRAVRLPREAEWEYACRAGTQTRFWSGDTEDHLARVGWYSKNSGGQSHVVGELPKNPWGLYDMHGNVWEWCADEWVNSYKGRDAGVVVDPAKPPSPGSPGAVRVLRGGGWALGAQGARSAYRNLWLPGIGGSAGASGFCCRLPRLVEPGSLIIECVAVL